MSAKFAGSNPLSLEAIEEVQVNLAPDGLTVSRVPADQLEFSTTTYRPVIGLSQTWSAQIGLRLSFN